MRKMGWAAAAATYAALLALNLSPERVPLYKRPTAAEVASPTPVLTLAPEGGIEVAEVAVVCIPAELRPCDPPIYIESEGELECLETLLAQAQPEESAPGEESATAVVVADAAATLPAEESAGAQPPETSRNPATEAPPTSIAIASADNQAEAKEAKKDSAKKTEAAKPGLVAIAKSTPTPKKAAAGPVYTHVVKRGDTLSKIAELYNVPALQIARANNLSSRLALRVGETLFIPDRDGISVAVSSGDTLWSIANRYGVKIDDVLVANNLKRSSSLTVGQRLFLPGVKQTRREREHAARLVSRVYNPVRKDAEYNSARSVSTTSYFVWPAKGELSSTYGWRQNPMGGGENKFHYGIDISAPRGTKIIAARGGVVSYSGWRGSFGRTIVIDHDDGYATTYAHCASLLVPRGTVVKQGQTIATVGSTGASTGNHLHFEVRQNGRAINPLTLLKR